LKTTESLQQLSTRPHCVSLMCEWCGESVSIPAGHPRFGQGRQRPDYALLQAIVKVWTQHSLGSKLPCPFTFPMCEKLLMGTEERDIIYASLKEEQNNYVVSARNIKPIMDLLIGWCSKFLPLNIQVLESTLSHVKTEIQESMQRGFTEQEQRRLQVSDGSDDHEDGDSGNQLAEEQRYIKMKKDQAKEFYQVLKLLPKLTAIAWFRSSRRRVGGFTGLYLYGWTVRGTSIGINLLFALGRFYCALNNVCLLFVRFGDPRNRLRSGSHPAHKPATWVLSSI